MCSPSGKLELSERYYRVPDSWTEPDHIGHQSMKIGSGWKNIYIYWWVSELLLYEVWRSPKEGHFEQSLPLLLTDEETQRTKKCEQSCLKKMELTVNLLQFCLGFSIKERRADWGCHWPAASIWLAYFLAVPLDQTNTTGGVINKNCGMQLIEH